MHLLLSLTRETLRQWEKIYLRVSPVNINSPEVLHLIMSVAPPGGATLTKPGTKDMAFSSWYSLQHLECCLCKRLTFSPFILLFMLLWFLQEQVYGEVLYFSTPLMGLLFPEPFPLLLMGWGAAESDPNNQIKNKFNTLYGKRFISAASNHRYSEYIESNVSEWISQWVSHWVGQLMSEWVTKWVSVCQWMSESVCK